MKRFCLLAAVLLSASAAHAQIAEAYATVDFSHISNAQTGVHYNSTSSTLQFTSLSPVGIGGGVTFNFLPLPVVKLGLDLRGSTRSGTVGADTALGGIKLTISPPLLKPKFFVEGAAGYLATRTNDVTTNNNLPPGVTANAGGSYQTKYAVYQIIGGGDYPLIHFVDFRVEAAGGASFGNGGFISVGNGDGSSAKIFSVNTGFVVHF